MTRTRPLLENFKFHVMAYLSVVISSIFLLNTSASAEISPVILIISGIENSCIYDHQFNWGDLPDSAPPQVNKKDLTAGTHYKVVNNCGSGESLFLQRGTNQLDGFVWYSDASTESNKLLPNNFTLAYRSSAFLYVPSTTVITSSPLGDFKTLVFNEVGMFLPFTSKFTVGNPIIVDSIAPTILEVKSSTADGSYRVGHQISIDVQFSESVTVSTVLGSPTIRLETGSNDNVATFISGSGTSVLTFIYQVQSGDESVDLDYVSSTAIQLNNSSISDSAGNNAVTSTPAPGSDGSIAATSQIVLDTQSPSVSISRLGTLTLGSEDVAFVEFDMNEIVVHFEEASIDVIDGVLSNFDGSMDHYTVQVSGAQNAEGNIRLSIPANSFEDLAGNGNVASEFFLIPFKTLIDATSVVDGVVEPVMVIASEQEKPVETAASSSMESAKPQPVALLQRTTLPATGDNSTRILWFAFLLLASGYAFLTPVRRIQKKKYCE